jgi:hypothetical protein
MIGTTRIHISGLPNNASQEDVTQLISKVCPVVEVHIPERDAWGFRRNFAVVRVQAESSKVQNCIRSFNGSMWKGSKIRLDLAKEWYQDRMQREREAEAERLKLEQSERQKEKEIDVMTENFSGYYHQNFGRHFLMLQKLQQSLPIWSHSMLKIRRAKSMKSLKICATPKINFNDKLMVSKSANAICKPYSTKIIFDEECYGAIVAQEELVSYTEYQDKMKKIKDADATLKRKKDDNQDGKDKGKHKESYGTGKDNTSSAFSGSSSAAPVAKIGGKGRVGFGSLMKDPLPEPIENRVDCCIEDSKVCGKRSNQRISEYDDFGGSTLEIVEIEDNTPCVLPEMLEDEVLQNERNRALEFAMSILRKAEEKQSKKSDKRSQQTTQPKQQPAPLLVEETPQEITLLESETNKITESHKTNTSFINLNTFKNIFHKEVTFFFSFFHVLTQFMVFYHFRRKEFGGTIMSKQFMVKLTCEVLWNMMCYLKKRRRWALISASQLAKVFLT